MINRMTAMSDDLTDFNIGSKVRTVLEATATEIDQYYQAMLKGLYEAVPVAIYKTFSFDRTAEAAASGYVLFQKSGTSEVTIPKGTQVQIPGGDYVYETQEDFTIASSETQGYVYVVCSDTGEETNCLTSVITEIVSTLDDAIVSVSNPSAFTTGSDEETDLERKLRFQQWLNTLARSTKSSIEYGTSIVNITDDYDNITEEVVKYIVHEPCIDDDPAGDVGYVNVYLWNGVDGASTELIAKATKELYGYTDDDGEKVPGWKGAGIILTVYAVSLDIIPVTATVTVDEDEDQTAIEVLIKQAIDDYFQSLDIGKTLIWAELHKVIKSVDGVEDLSLTAPEANSVATDWYYKNVMGTVTLSYLTE